jgi:hypothetical protein
MDYFHLCPVVNLLYHLDYLEVDLRVVYFLHQKLKRSQHLRHHLNHLLQQYHFLHMHHDHHQQMLL